MAVYTGMDEVLTLFCTHVNSDLHSNNPFLTQQNDMIIMKYSMNLTINIRHMIKTSFLLVVVLTVSKTSRRCRSEILHTSRV